MRTETTLVTAAMFVAGVLLGWLATSRKSRRFCTSPTPRADYVVPLCSAYNEIFASLGSRTQGLR
jgi:hypothetical protein